MSSLGFGAGRRLSLSLSTWFCIPEQGMRSLEILSRSSAAVVATQRPTIPGSSSPQPQFHVVTSSHVVAPWRWPRYYPEEWLRAVTPAHTHYSVELRHPDGMFLASLDLEPTSFHHACRDLAVLRFEDPVDALATLHEFNYSPLKLLADRPGAELSIGDTVTVSGHEILGEVLADGTDLRRPIPMTTAGQVRRRQGAWPATQCFLATERVLTLGMCGGPAVKMVAGQADQAVLAPVAMATAGGVRPASRKSKTKVAAEWGDASCPAPAGSESESGPEPLLCGVVEGIVPLDFPDERLAGLAVVVESRQVSEFLDAVEAGAVPEVDTLRGGEAALWVGEQQEDGGEMDVLKLIERSEAQAEADEAKARGRPQGLGRGPFQH